MFYWNLVGMFWVIIAGCYLWGNAEIWITGKTQKKVSMQNAASVQVVSFGADGGIVQIF